MKKPVLLLMIVISVAGINTVQAQKTKWLEMETFHTVIAQTFHPAEEGKLEPIKTRSQEMFDKALAWQKSTTPEGYNKKGIKGLLKNLVKESKDLNKLIKTNAADNTLKEKLSGLHDIFHEIMEKCETEDHNI
ncbi:MAG: hypothetical protein JJE22_14045 [Bacteroidia bacterium]|nr:hypothetical protein [Bacteroidia bacterium]